MYDWRPITDWTSSFFDSLCGRQGLEVISSLEGL